MDFADAMRAAIDLTRDRRLAEATRMISACVGGSRTGGCRRGSRGGHRRPCAYSKRRQVACDCWARGCHAGCSDAAKSSPKADSSAAGADGSGVLPTSDFPAECLQGAQGPQAARDPGRRTIPELLFCLRRREPQLQTLLPSDRRGGKRPLVDHAARRYPGRRRLCRRDTDACSGGGARVDRCICQPVKSRQRFAVLELVLARASDARTR